MAIQQTYSESIDNEGTEPAPFHPAPLSWLLACLFSPRHAQVADETEPFEEHINGLA